jgi:hypothetical protein
MQGAYWYIYVSIYQHPPALHITKLLPREEDERIGSTQIFCGVKIAPLPLPALFPRAAVPSGTN